MISHALTIVANELNKHLNDNFNNNDDPPRVKLGNFSEGVGTTGGLERNKLYISLVNIKEEKALKNLPNYVRDDVKLTAIYENSPVYLNFQILMAATHTDYNIALLMLSRIISFFQCKNVFTQDSVHSSSIKDQNPLDSLDRLEEFKLIFDLYSPAMEEVNHLWGTLGGKQYPFVLYMMRMLDLKFKATQSESGLITEVISDFSHKAAVKSRD